MFDLDDLIEESDMFFDGADFFDPAIIGGDG